MPRETADQRVQRLLARELEPIKQKLDELLKSKVTTTVTAPVTNPNIGPTTGKVLTEEELKHGEYTGAMGGVVENTSDVGSGGMEPTKG